MRDSYRDIPIPPLVDRLRRTRSGMPVPWPTLASPGDLHVVEDPHTGATAMCTCAPDEGAPAFGELCPIRQRQAVLQRRCGICGQRIKHTTLSAFISTNPAADGIEPPAHPRCMAFALQACPRLAELVDRALVLLSRSYAITERRMVGYSEEPGQDPTPVWARYPLNSQAPGVLDFYLVTPTNPETIPAREWLTTHAPPLT